MFGEQIGGLRQIMSKVKGLNITPVELIVIGIVIAITFVVGLNAQAFFDPEFTIRLLESLFIGIFVAVITGVILSIFITKSRA